MWEASLVTDYFPEPPTPINMAFPLGYHRILEILKMCSMQSSKKTRFILPQLAML